MVYSSDWQLTEVKEYSEQNGRPPIFVSNWDSDPGNQDLIGGILRSAVNTSAHALSDYAYGEDLAQETSCFLQALARGGNRHLQPQNIAITLNATNALYLCLQALKILGATRYLVITPTYYSVIETLHSLGSTVIYHHLLDDDGFILDLDTVRRAVKWQQIDAIVLTDPIYSAGIEFDIATYLGLYSICNEYHIWLLCDYALGGLSWRRSPTRLLNAEKLSMIADLKRFVYIESPPKRLMLNGMKHAVIAASPSVTRLIHDLAARITGGFCVTQLSLFSALYHSSSEASLVAYMDSNRQHIEANFGLLGASVLGTAFQLYPSNSGHFTMLCHKHRRIGEVDSKRIVRHLLWQHGLYALPSEHFSYYPDNHFGIRVNLMNDLAGFLSPLHRALAEDAELFDAFR